MVCVWLIQNHLVITTVYQTSCLSIVLPKIPVLASDYPEISRVIKKYDFGIACSNNIEYIAKEIKKFRTKKDFITLKILKILAGKSRKKN